MKLVGRQLVEGSEPSLYIGHRVSRCRKTGAVRTSRLFYSEWNHEGRRFYERLKTTNKQVAIRRAHEICQRINRGEAAPPVAAEIVPMLTEFAGTIRGMGRKPATSQKYDDVLGRQFAAFLNEKKIVYDRQFGEVQFWAFGEALIARGLSPKTRHNYLIIVKQFWRWAARVGRIAKNPVAACRLTEPPDTEQYCPSPEVVGLLLKRADNHLRRIILFLSHTGARFGEAAALQWSDLDLKAGSHGFVRFSRGGSGGTTKSGKSRRVPLHPSVREMLNALPRHPKSSLVFQAGPSEKHPDGSGPISERRVLRSLKRLAQRCGLEEWERVTLHSFRHFLASSLARRRISYKYALEFMGHSSSKILDLYFRMFDPDAEQAIQAIEIIEPPPDNPTAKAA
jgi:integrase